MLSCLRRSSAPQEEKALGRPPLFLAFRSSTPFIALTVGLGVLVDLAGYSIAVPVVPFRLEELGMPDVASRTGWLIAAYAAGLIIGAPPMAYIGSRIKSRRVPLIFALLFMAGCESSCAPTSATLLRFRN